MRQIYRWYAGGMTSPDQGAAPIGQCAGPDHSGARGRLAGSALRRELGGWGGDCRRWTITDGADAGRGFSRFRWTRWSSGWSHDQACLFAWSPGPRTYYRICQASGRRASITAVRPRRSPSRRATSAGWLGPLGSCGPSLGLGGFRPRARARPAGSRHRHPSQGRRTPDIGELHPRLGCTDGGDYRQGAAILIQVAETLKGDRSGEFWQARSGMFGSVTSRAYLAWCLAELGEFAQAMACSDEALRIARSPGPTNSGCALSPPTATSVWASCSTAPVPGQRLPST